MKNLLPHNDYLLFCVADGEDAEFDTFGLGQFLAAGDDGGASGHYIVNNQKVLAFYLVGINQLKGCPYVLAALPDAGLVRLTLTEMLSLDYLIIYREMCDIANAFCHLHTLVITSFPLASACDGHWYDGIDVIEEAKRLMSQGDLFADILAQQHLSMVFQVVYHLAGVGMRTVVKPGRCLLYWKLSPEESGHEVIVRRLGKGCLLQFVITVSAEQGFLWF